MKLIVYVMLSHNTLYSHCLPEKCQRQSQYKVLYQRKRDSNLLSKLQNLLPFKWLSAQVILATSLTKSLLSKKVITKTCIGGQSIRFEVNLTLFGKNFSIKYITASSFSLLLRCHVIKTFTGDVFCDIKSILVEREQLFLFAWTWDQENSESRQCYMQGSCDFLACITGNSPQMCQRQISAFI